MSPDEIAVARGPSTGGRRKGAAGAGASASAKRGEADDEVLARAAGQVVAGLLWDPSLWTLVGANALAGWFAIRDRWTPAAMAWAFVAQTAIMVAFHYVRIRWAREFAFGSYHCSINGRQLPNAREGLREHAREQVVFSAVLLGMVMPGLLIVTATSGGLQGQLAPLLWMAAAFFGHSLLEFILGRVGTPRCEHIAVLAITPELRSVSMLFWLFLLFPACWLLGPAGARWNWIPLVAVLALKTAVDLLVFAIERLGDAELKGLATRLPRRRAGRGAARGP